MIQSQEFDIDLLKTQVGSIDCLKDPDEIQKLLNRIDYFETYCNEHLPLMKLKEVENLMISLCELLLKGDIDDDTENALSIMIQRVSNVFFPTQRIMTNITGLIQQSIWAGEVTDRLVFRLIKLFYNVIGDKKCYQTAQEPCFLFSGEAESFITNKSDIKWPFSQGLSLMTSFYPDSTQSFDIFRFLCIFEEGQKKNEYGIRCCVLGGKIVYQIIYKRFKDLTLVEDYGQEYQLGVVEYNQWNYIGVDHEPSKTFSKPHLSFFVNQQPVKLIVAEYPKIPTNIETQINFFHNFNGKSGSIFVFSSVIGPKLAQFQALYKSGVGLNFPLNQTHIETLPQVFEKAFQKLLYLITPIRVNKNLAYDLINKNLFLLGQECFVSQTNRLRQIHGLKLILPLFYLIRFTNNQTEHIKQAIRMLSKWMEHTCDYLQEQLERNFFFDILVNLLTEIKGLVVDMDIINYLILIKSHIRRSQLLDQYLIKMLWNNKLMKSLAPDMQIEKSYCMLIQSFYFLNSSHFTKLKEVKDIINVIAYVFTCPQKLCCSFHSFEMGSRQQVKDTHQSYMIDGLLEIIGLIVESDSNAMVSQIEQLFWLTTVQAPCVQIKILRLCRRTLLIKKKDCQQIVWQNLINKMVERKIVNDLLYFVQNSPCLEVKSLSLKFINLLTLEDSNILNENDLISFSESKISILSFIDPTLNKVQPIISYKRKEGKRKLSENNIKTIIQLRRPSLDDTLKVHLNVQKEFIINAMIEYLMNHTYNEIDYIHQCQNNQHNLRQQETVFIKLQLFYDSLLEWMLGIMPKDIKLLTSYDENTRIQQARIMETLFVLYSVVPKDFKQYILVNLTNLIDVSKINADIIINQTEFIPWLLNIIHQKLNIQPDESPRNRDEHLQIALNLILKILLDSKSHSLYQKFQSLYIWSRGKLRDQKNDAAKWTLRYVIYWMGKKINVKDCFVLFSYIKIIEEFVVCLDQYLKESLLTQTMDDVLIAPQKKQISAQMCLTFMDEQSNIPARIQIIIANHDWVDATLVQLGLEQILAHIMQLTSEESQDEFMKNFFDETQSYIGFIRLLILYIQYLVRNPQSTKAEIQKWIGELSNIVISIYCHRNSIQKGDDMENAIIFIFSFFLKMIGDENELLDIIKSKINEISSIAKPVLSKLIPDFDFKQFQSSDQYKLQILKHPRVISSVKFFNCNYGQLLEQFNFRINENYYNWTISLNMNNENKQASIKKIENQIYDHLSSKLEDDDIRRNTFLQIEELNIRNSRNQWKKLWNRLRLFGPYSTPDLQFQFDKEITSSSLTYDNYNPSPYLQMKMSKYLTRSQMRPFLKLKPIEPKIVIEYQEKNAASLGFFSRSRLSVIKSHIQNKLIHNFNPNLNGWDLNKKKIIEMAASIKEGLNAIGQATERLVKPLTNSRKSMMVQGSDQQRRLSVTIETINNQQERIIEASFTFVNIRCQWIKTLTTRNGSISLSEDGMLIFQYERVEQQANHISLKQHLLQPNRSLLKQWNVRQIENMQQRSYILNEFGIEIFFTDGDSLYLNLYNLNDFENIQQKLTDAISIFEDQRLWDKQNNLALIEDLWLDGKISNFTYLMKLNQLSSRSYRDLTRYPVFPWVLKGRLHLMEQYNTVEESLQIVEDYGGYRDLKEPMGSVGSQQRAEEYMLRYQMQTETDQDSFHYGSHYSSSAIVAQYLIRIEPFTTAAKEIQGGRFDLPDRIFINVSKTWVDATEEMADIRELIPEFYYLPELLLNLQKLNMGKLQSDIQVHNVQLPAFTNSPFVYVTANKLALEEEICSKNLHEWIDLIWGYKSRGEQAAKALNVFYPLTYPEHLKSLQPINDQIMRLSIETQVANFGITPNQLFKAPHPPRKNKHKSIFNRSDYKLIDIKQPKARRQSITTTSTALEQIVLLEFQGQNKLVTLKLGGQITYYKWQSNPFLCVVEKQKTLNSFPAQQQLSNFDFTIQYRSQPFAIYKKYLICGGLWEGLLLIINIETDQIIHTYTHHIETITSVAIDDRGTQVITGTKGGESTLWVSDQGLKMKPFINNLDHQDIITQIKISEELRIYLTSCAKGRINMYNLYNGQFYRAIFHPDSLPIHHLNISHTPLPCIVFSSDNNDMLYSYSVNGFKLASLMETSPLTASQVVNDFSNHTQILIYTTLMGSCQLISLPFLHKKNFLPTAIFEVSLIKCSHQGDFVYGTIVGDLYVNQ